MGLTPQNPDSDTDGGHIGKDERQVNRVQDYIYELVFVSVCPCLYQCPQHNNNNQHSALARLDAEGLAPGNGKVHWLNLDLSHPRGAVDSAKAFMEKEERLDILSTYSVPCIFRRCMLYLSCSLRFKSTMHRCKPCARFLPTLRF